MPRFLLSELKVLKCSLLVLTMGIWFAWIVAYTLLTFICSERYHAFHIRLVMKAARTCVSKLELLSKLLADDIAIKVRIHIHFIVGKRLAVRFLLVTTQLSLNLIFVTTLESEALFLSWYTSKVCCEIHQVDLVNMVHHTLTASVFPSEARDLPSEIFEETILFLISMVTFSASAFARATWFACTDEIAAWLLRMFGLAFLAEHFLIFLVGALLRTEYEF